MKTKEKIEFSRIPKDYAGLCRFHAPRPVRDEVEFDNATEITMAMAGHKLTADQEDYLDLVSRLIEDYEQEHTPPIKRVSGLEALKHLLEENSMNASDLARLLGVHRTLGAMILRGERQLTVSHIQALAKRFAVSAEVFLG